MNKSAWTIARINLRNLMPAYLTVIIIEAAQIIQGAVYMILHAATGNSYENSGLSTGNVLWLIPLIAAFLLPLVNLRRTINLGGKRGDFIRGSFLLYVILAFFCALANTAVYYTLDRFIQNSGAFSETLFRGVMNVVEIFGWVNNGPILAFLQSFAFLLMTTMAIHTLVAMQDKWYGWAADFLIAAIISVCTPIAALRPILLGFFWLIIYQPNAFLQILACLVIAAVAFLLARPIFARKVI